jgi:cytochrome c2
MLSRFALAASLAFTVAACGSSEQPSDASTGAAVAVPSEDAAGAPAAVTSEAAPSATPAAETSATPSATPTATKASPAASPAPAASGAGAASPPQAFNQCTACHSTAPGKTIIGPSLAGVYGHKAGQVPGFQFSDAMKSSGLVLNEKNLDAFLANPTAKVPGTTMVFAGVKDEKQRQAIIDYLKTL